MHTRTHTYTHTHAHTHTHTHTGVPYWYNRHTLEARWNMPPSCAWQKVEVQNQPARYVNYVTGQTMHTLPRVSVKLTN
jgi:hypothetical protein